MRVLLLTMSMWTAAFASSVLIDFEEFPTDTSELYRFYHAPLTSKGFDFIVDPPALSWNAFFMWQDFGQGLFDPPYTGSNALALDDPSAILRISHSGGSPFDMVSIRMADAFQDVIPTAQVVTFTGIRADLSTWVNTFTVPGTSGSAGIATYNFVGMTNIIALTMDDTSADHVQIDDLEINVVPEPLTLSAIGLGLAWLGKRRLLNVQPD